MHACLYKPCLIYDTTHMPYLYIATYKNQIATGHIIKP